MAKYFWLISFMTLGFFSQAAVPDIVNFTPKDYHQHSINYCFAQDSNGVIYVGNAYGLLEYDGISWRSIDLVDGKSALSMDVDHQGRVYIGSSYEFGYLQKNQQGINEYVSLKDLLPDYDILEILDVVCHKNGVYFRTLHSIYLYADDAVIELNPFDQNFLTYYLGQEKQGMKAFQLGVGTFDIDGSTYRVIPEAPKSKEVKEVLEFDSAKLFIALNEIIDPTHPTTFHNINEKLKKLSITSSLKINENEFMLGTTNHGIFHFNIKGQIISNYTTENGLQDNFVRNLFQDQAGDIWIAYDNGIGVIKWHSPIRYITSSMGIEGMGYCAVVHLDTLFVGTSRGVYFMDQWSNKLSRQQKFKKVTGISSTIYDLKVQKNAVIACQAAEVYQVNGGRAKRISPGFWYGAWLWKNNPLDSNKAFVGTYLGISSYQYQNSSWKFVNHIKGFEESSRVFEVDHRGIIWVVQGNKGLFRVELNDTKDSAISVTNYVDVIGEKSQDYFNDIFTYHDSIFVSTHGKTYCLDKDSLVELKSFSSLGKKANRIRKYNNEGLYAIYNDQAHVLTNKNIHWTVSNTPVSFLKSLLVGSAEFFTELTSGFYLIGTQDGFATYNATSSNGIQATPCLIRGVSLINSSGDSTLYNDNPSEALKFDYQHNNLRISYSIPVFGENNQLSYETRLFKKGKPTHNWQKAHSINFKEYTNLKEGKYTFHVRAKKGDEIAGSTQFNFSISPPWYRTIFAYFVYFILWIITILTVIKLFLNQKKKLEEEKKRELEIKEKLHHTEKLEIELKNKENELAYVALNYTRKKDLLASLTSQLNKISKDLEHEQQIKFRTVKSAIANNLDDESNWENFQVHFDEKNDNFFQKLKDMDKKLNESNLLFCSYVRMGKPNKEIAELLNLSVAAVEKRKYRLKKKWDLPDDTSFTEFLRNL